MNYQVIVTFSDEDDQEPFTQEEIVEALYAGRFPSQRLTGSFFDIKEIEVHRY